MTGAIRTVLACAALGVVFGWWDAQSAALFAGVAP